MCTSSFVNFTGPGNQVITATRFCSGGGSHHHGDANKGEAEEPHYAILFS
jgi:hypothetical protein